MTVMTTLPRGREFTYDDLQSTPDDGNRYEIVDGALIVTPSPITRHQRAVGRLYILLHAACPPDHETFLAPYDVKLSERTVLQPDLLVAPRHAFAEKNLPLAPLLAVEVLSPSTRHIDLGLKRGVYEAAGTSAYWVIDPAVPSVVAWRLVDGVYVEEGRGQGEQEVLLEHPFPIRIVPADLRDA